MKLLKKTIQEIIQEAISLDISPGDVILTGRFKNKRKIVKTIGTDKYGQPTINGKSILKFKIEKNMPKNKWSAKSREELKESTKRNKMKLRETIRKLIKESAEEQMYIEKLNSMLDIYNEQKSSDYQTDNSIYDQAIELATTLGLEEHPGLKVWGAVNADEDYEIIASGLTEEEALSLTEHDGYTIRTDGERDGYYFLYYDVEEINEIVQIPIPKRGERAVHKVEEEVTEEMLEDIISVLPLWEAGEYEQVEILIQDMHTIGRNQLHNLMNAAEEMATYGQISDDVPEWVTDYFHDKFSEGWEPDPFGE